MFSFKNLRISPQIDSPSICSKCILCNIFDIIVSVVHTEALNGLSSLLSTNEIIDPTTNQKAKMENENLPEWTANRIIISKSKNCQTSRVSSLLHFWYSCEQPTHTLKIWTGSEPDIFENFQIWPTVRWTLFYTNLRDYLLPVFDWLMTKKRSKLGWFEMFQMWTVLECFWSSKPHQQVSKLQTSVRLNDCRQ